MLPMLSTMANSTTDAISARLKTSTVTSNATAFCNRLGGLPLRLENGLKCWKNLGSRYMVKAIQGPRAMHQLEDARAMAKQNPAAVASIVRGWVSGEAA